MTSAFLRIKDKLPMLGIGLGLRRDLADDTFKNTKHIDWLEIAPENYMGVGGRARGLVEEASGCFPLISHGLTLSIGSTDCLNQDYLKELKHLLDAVNAPWWSDHLCFSGIDGFYVHDLLPLPFTTEAVSHIAERIKRVQDYIGRPFLVENISFYMHAPGSEMTEAQFLSEVVEAADCGLLLDVNNIYVNSINHNLSPDKFIAEIPLERTVQIHVAGHKQIGETIIDTHGAPVIEPVYRLLEDVLKRTKVNGVMLERDQNFPEFGEILDELNCLRKIVQATQPALAAVGKDREVADVSRLSA